MKRMYGNIGLYTLRYTTIKEVAVEVGVNYGAVQRFIKKYVDLKGRFPWPGREVCGVKTCKLDDLQDFLLRQQTLVSWRGLSLAKRCAKIWEISDYQCKITAPTLGNFY